MIQMNNVQIDLGEGYRLSISQYTDGKSDLTYSNRRAGTVEIAIFDPDGNFFPLQEHDDVLGWMNFDDINNVVERFRKEVR